MSRAADSAGIPFDGREFRAHPFQGDDGSAPESLENALSRWASEKSPSAVSDVVEALRTSRVLVPLLAEAGEFGVTDSGHVVDKSQELSIVTVEGPDGQPVAVCFSDTESMSRWRADSRPVPVEAQKVAAWVVEDQLGRAVINPGSDTECVLRRGAIVSLLTGDPYRSPADDPEIVHHVSAAFEQFPVDGVSLHIGWDLVGGNGPDLILQVALAPGLSAEQLHERQAHWAKVWAASPVLNRYVDGIRLKIVASSPGR
jgi:hypothetical protein